MAGRRIEKVANLGTKAIRKRPLLQRTLCIFASLRLCVDLYVFALKNSLKPQTVNSGAKDVKDGARWVADGL